MAMTKVYSVWVIGGAAVLSVVCGFIGKFSALISTIPGPVIGGISFLLYGMIGASGLRILVDAKVDYGRARNQALTAVVFVTGLSGITVNLGNIQLTGHGAGLRGRHDFGPLFLYHLTGSIWPMTMRTKTKKRHKETPALER